MFYLFKLVHYQYYSEHNGGGSPKDYNGVRVLPSRTTNRMAPVFTQAPIQWDNSHTHVDEVRGGHNSMLTLAL